MAKGSDAVKKLPVILLTGFLGAGKTTLLNNLVKYLDLNQKKTALIINEFGKVNIDKELIEQNKQNVFEVNQGSIFCACTKDQFIDAVTSVLNSKPLYDILLIEATGIAKTSDFGKYLMEAGLLDKIMITNNICLIDAANFHKVFETLPAVKNQVMEASLCVINKIDEVAFDKVDELKRKIKLLNKDADIVLSEYGQIDFQKIIENKIDWSTNVLMDTSPPSDIKTVTLSTRKVISKNKIELFVKSHIKDILRAKGYILIHSGWRLFEVTGGKITYKPFKKDFKGGSRLVIIGKNIDEDQLRQDFKESLI